MKPSIAFGVVCALTLTLASCGAAQPEQQCVDHPGIQALPSHVKSAEERGTPITGRCTFKCRLAAYVCPVEGGVVVCNGGGVCR